MTDPFDALREPVTPADPGIGFAVALRMRLTREIFGPSGGTMSQQTVAAAVEREPAWPPTLTPYIVVSDARRAMDWYVEVFAAQRRGELHVNADGTIGHAEVGIGDAVLMFAEASGLWPDVPVRAPDSPATFSHTLHLQVGDVDGTTERARRNGASVEREPADQPYGRGAVIVDPFGHRWMLLRPPARATRLRQGDVANVAMMTPDSGRAKEFYEAVLQVPFSAGHPGAWRTEQITPPLAIMPSAGTEPEVQLSFRVDDIAAAVERVRAAGGRADDPQRRRFGLSTECVDDQGTTFRLWQPADLSLRDRRGFAGRLDLAGQEPELGRSRVPGVNDRGPGDDVVQGTVLALHQDPQESQAEGQEAERERQRAHPPSPVIQPRTVGLYHLHAQQRHSPGAAVGRPLKAEVEELPGDVDDEDDDVVPVEGNRGPSHDLHHK
ncbi:MAG TPA: VOC family protein [Trebonia sp.]|nr:VOC family protein [Trebonia sp.]